MPLKKIWNQIFHPEIQFRVLKSQSSVELSYYNHRQRGTGSNFNVRKFNSYYDTFDLFQDNQQVDNDNHIECNCDEGANLCYSFWHVENKSKVDIANDKNTPGVEIGSPANRTSLQKYVLRTFETFCNDTNLLKSILLKSIESESLYPFICFNVTNEEIIPSSNGETKLSTSNYSNPKFRFIHGLYKKLYSINCTEGSNLIGNEFSLYPGCLLFSYKILNFDAIEQLESHWTQWSGANYLYKCCPKSWRLNKITFYKLSTKPKPWNFIYILLCEFNNLMQPENLPVVCETVERLKLRGCGHVGVYKVQESFAKFNSDNEPVSKSTDNNNDFSFDDGKSSILSLASSRYSSQDTITTSVSYP